MKYIIISILFLVSTNIFSENFRFDHKNFEAKEIQFVADEETWDCTEKIVEKGIYDMPELGNLFTYPMSSIFERIMIQKNSHYMIILTHSSNIEIYDIHTGEAKLLKTIYKEKI